MFSPRSVCLNRAGWWKGAEGSFRRALMMYGARQPKCERERENTLTISLCA